MQQMDDRPPYVEWRRVPVEDREASLLAGRYVAKDVDIAVVMRPGSRDTVEKDVQTFFSDWDARVRNKQCPPEWPRAWRQSYEAWKAGEELPVNGTPIKGWALLSPAQQQNLIAAKVLTVEDLAALPDQELQVVGVGATGIREQARSWLKAADQGKLAAENADLRQKVADLTAAVQTLMGRLDEAKASAPKPQESLAAKAAKAMA